MKNNHLKVRKINEGTVIDHVRPGFAPVVLKILGINPGTEETVVVAMNARSFKSPWGRKDIVKIENRFLEEDQLNRIAVISPQATINIIREGEVKEKWQVEMPEKVEGVMKCPNRNCISNDPAEPIISRFLREGDKLRCHFCERLVEEKELPFLV